MRTRVSVRGRVTGRRGRGRATASQKGIQIEAKHQHQYDEDSASNLEEFPEALDISKQITPQQMFDEKIGLQSKIEEKIYPCIRLLSTPEGVGMGFYQFQDYFISSAHVIPNVKILASSSMMIPGDKEMSIEAIESYHRNFQVPGAPDIVIIKPKHACHSALPVSFFGDRGHVFDKKGVEKIHTFYIAYDEVACAYTVKYLQPCSHSNAIPMLYLVLQEDNPPEPGDSGAVIIEARVAGEGALFWDFRVCGILYGRSVSSTLEGGVKRVCAIPVLPDLRQLLNDILGKQRTAERVKQMAMVSTLFHDEIGKKNTEKYQAMHDEAVEQVRRGLEQFESGATSLDISVPTGFEPLGNKKKNEVVEVEVSSPHKYLFEYMNGNTQLNLATMLKYAGKCLDDISKQAFNVKVQEIARKFTLKDDDYVDLPSNLSGDINPKSIVIHISENTKDPDTIATKKKKIKELYEYLYDFSQKKIIANLDAYQLPEDVSSNKTYHFFTEDFCKKHGSSGSQKQSKQQAKNTAEEREVSTSTVIAGSNIGFFHQEVQKINEKGSFKATMNVLQQDTIQSAVRGKSVFFKTKQPYKTYTSSSSNSNPESKTDPFFYSVVANEKGEYIVNHFAGFDVPANSIELESDATQSKEECSKTEELLDSDLACYYTPK